MTNNIHVKNSKYFKLSVDSALNLYDLTQTLLNIADEESLDDIAVVCDLLPKLVLQYNHKTFNKQVINIIMQYPNDDINVTIDDNVEIRLTFDEEQGLRYVNSCLIALQKLLAMRLDNAPVIENTAKALIDDDKTKNNSVFGSDDSKLDVSNNDDSLSLDNLADELKQKTDDGFVEPNFNEDDELPDLNDNFNNTSSGFEDESISNEDDLPGLDDDSDNNDNDSDENDELDKLSLDDSDIDDQLGTSDEASNDNDAINDNESKIDIKNGSLAPTGTIKNVSNTVSDDQIRAVINSDDNLVKAEQLDPIYDKLNRIERLVEKSNSADDIKSAIEKDPNVVTSDKLQTITGQINNIKEQMPDLVKRQDLADYVKHSDMDSITSRIDTLHEDIAKAHKDQVDYNSMMIRAFIDAGKKANAEPESINVLTNALQKIDSAAANELNEQLSAKSNDSKKVESAPQTPIAVIDNSENSSVSNTNTNKNNSLMDALHKKDNAVNPADVDSWFTDFDTDINK